MSTVPAAAEVDAPRTRHRAPLALARLREPVGRSSLNGLLTVVKVGFAFGAGVIYSRALGPTGRGEVAFVVGVASLLSMVAGAGLAPGAKHVRIRRGEPLERAAVVVTLARAGVVVVGWAALWLVGVPAVSHLRPAHAVAIIILVPGIALSHAALATAAVDRQETRLSLVNVAVAVVSVAVVAALWWAGALSVPVVLVLWGVTAVAPAAVVLRGAARRGTRGLTGALHRAALRAGLPELALFATWRIDTVIVGHLLGYRELGRYAVAASVAEGLTALMHGVRLWTLGRAGAGAAGGRRALAAVKASLVVGVPLALMTAAAGPTGVRMLFGPEFGDVAIVLWCLLPGAVVFGLSFVLADQLGACGGWRSATVVLTAALVLNIGTDLALVPRYGLAAAALASTAAYLVGFMGLWWALRRRIERSEVAAWA